VPFGSSQIISLGGSLKQDTQVRKATGYLIPYSEQKDISAITFSSWKWENRAPEGKALFRVFFNDKERSEEEMISLSLEELKQSCNISLDLELSHVTKWINKRPQYLVGHKQRMNDLSGQLTKLGGISIAGASYTGIGVPDCIKIASETAYELSKSLKG